MKKLWNHLRLVLYVLVALGFGVALDHYQRSLGDYLVRLQARTSVSERQHLLLMVAQRDAIVKGALRNLLATNPSFARVRVGLLHDGNTVTGADPQWDMVVGLVAAGHDDYQLPSNMPLSQWSDYLGLLLKDQCSLLAPAEMQNEAVKTRLISMNTQKMLICPIVDQKSNLLGGVFAIWDMQSVIPDDIEPTKRSLRATASYIGQSINSLK